MSNLTWGYGSGPALAGDDFPQLAASADPVMACRQLDPAASGCELVNLWYIPGRALRAVYRLGEQVTTVHFFRGGASARAYAEARLAAADPGALRHLPDWDAVAWRFPEDPGLPHLPAFLAETSALAGHAREVRLLSYLPGERCAVAVGNVVGKLQRAPGSDASHARLLQLWAQRGRGFRMPRPLAVAAGMGARWERFEPGVRLEAALRVGEPRRLLTAVLRGLVALHGVPLSGLATQEPDAILRRIERKVLPRIGVALPALAPHAADIHKKLAERAVTLVARAPVTAHGDLHTANILVGAAGPLFIDLDAPVAGDAAYDLALLATRMVLSATQSGGRADAALALATELPEMYAAAGGAPIPETVFAWYLAALYLGRQVKTCLRNAAPGAEALAASLLARAEDALAG